MTTTEPQTTTTELAKCPVCAAQRGQPCRNGRGPLATPHKRRQPMPTDALDAVVAEVAEAEAALRDAVERRNATMRELNAADPKSFSTRKLAARTGFSFQRVSQLLNP